MDAVLIAECVIELRIRPFVGCCCGLIFHTFSLHVTQSQPCCTLPKHCLVLNRSLCAQLHIKELKGNGQRKSCSVGSAELLFFFFSGAAEREEEEELEGCVKRWEERRGEAQLSVAWCFLHARCSLFL